jgi:hypothetical protein
MNVVNVMVMVQICVDVDWSACYCASQTPDACGECGNNTKCLEDGETCVANSSTVNECASDACDCALKCGTESKLDNCDNCRDDTQANGSSQSCAQDCELPFACVSSLQLSQLSNFDSVPHFKAQSQASDAHSLTVLEFATQVSPSSKHFVLFPHSPQASGV